VAAVFRSTKPTGRPPLVVCKGSEGTAAGEKSIWEPRGTDAAANLRAVCSVCNEGASNATLPRPDLLKLLTQLRRATAADQLEALRWLMRKFSAQARSLLPQPNSD